MMEYSFSHPCHEERDERVQPVLHRVVEHRRMGREYPAHLLRRESQGLKIVGDALHAFEGEVGRHVVPVPVFRSQGNDRHGICASDPDALQEVAYFRVGRLQTEAKECSGRGKRAANITGERGQRI